MTRQALLIGAALLLLTACGGPAGDAAGEPEGATPSAPSGPFHLTPVTEAAGIEMVHVGGSPTVDYIIESLGSGGAWLDYDLDGDPDLYLAQGAAIGALDEAPPDRLYRNEGDRNGDGVVEFTDVTDEAGLGDTRWSFGVAVADVENDGDPDVYLTNWGANRLYLNNGDGTFTDVAETAGVADEAWGCSAVWGDTDNDGDLDLYVANYVEFTTDRYPARGEPEALGPAGCIWKGIPVYCGPRGLAAARDVYYVNQGDTDGDGIPEFTDATEQAGLVRGPFYGLGALFFDADADGDADLYVANDSVENALFWNLGDGTFEEGGLIAGVAFNEEGREQAGMGVDSGDFDGDGLPDIAVTNFSHDNDALYRNEGDGLFSEISYPAGLGTPSFLTLGWGILFVDLDLDGWDDLFVSHGHVYTQVDEREIGTSYRQRNAVFRNRGDGTLEDLSERSGEGLAIVKSSRGAYIADMDDDGDPDLLVTNINDRPDLLRNDRGDGNSLGVRLRGVRSNRDGIGARILVQTGERIRVREMRRNHSFLGSSEPVAWFGLGDAAGVDRVVVRWPSGASTELRDVEAGQVIVVDEPAAE